MGQLLHALRVLHELLFLLQHSGKAAGRFQIERRFLALLRSRFRLRLCLGCSRRFLGGAVVLHRQVEFFCFFIQPGGKPALIDVSAQLFQSFCLFLVGQVGQHLHRQAFPVVHALRSVSQQAQLLGGRQPGGTGRDHGTKATRDKGQHIACDLQHRRGHGSASGKGIGHALRGRGHRVTDHGLRNKAGHHGFRCHNAANAAQPEDHRKGDAHSQQGAACAVALFGTGADILHGRRFGSAAEHLPEPAGHPAGVGLRIALVEGLLCPVLPCLAPRLAEGFARLPDAIVGRMDGRPAHIVGAVADVHAPALKAMGKGVGHGVAKGAQLVLQLLLHLTALVLDPVVVFTIVHQNLLTLLPVHTG